MPLKHFTETILIVLLAVITVLTGVLVSTLPHIPDGFLPWVGVFLGAVIFPALVYPLLKNNRADYSFRALHFAPVTIALVWMFIEIALLKEPRLQSLYRIYTWGWTAPAVVVTFVLLMAFCLQVLRRRVPRILFLTLLLVPFLVVAYASENYTHWNTQLASMLWDETVGDIAYVPGDSSSSASLTASSRGEKNLSSSSVPEEEAWRIKLREVEEGKVHPLTVSSSLAGVKSATKLFGANMSGIAASARSSATSEGKKHIVMKPRTGLTKSGGEMEAMAIFFVAGYCAVMHQRSRKRLMV